MSAVGKAIGDPRRAEILCVLGSGRPRSAGELAAHLGLAPSTTSRHLGLLVDAGLVEVEASGRHRYFRLGSPDVSDLLGALDRLDLPELSPAAPPGPTGIAVARTCYDHLAGDLAVGIYQSMTSSNLLEPPDDEGPRLTAAGHAHLRHLGIDTEHLGRQPRPLVRACVDWEQQTHHLGGAVGAALLDMMLKRHWLEPSDQTRAIAVTDVGARQLNDHFMVSGTGPAPDQASPGPRWPQK